MGYKMDKPKEKCAVLGIYSPKGENVTALAYQALFAMQHRGQDGAGMAGANGTKVNVHKGLGLVGEVFAQGALKRFEKCNIIIGHNRYATSAGTGSIFNTQPLVMHGRGGFIGMAHNGHIVNQREIRNALQHNGVLFQTELDSEAMLHLIARNPMGIEEGVREMMSQVRGSYALTLLAPGKLLGVRDPWGIRPLCIGTLDDGGYVLASESCALSSIGATFLRDVNPGEIVSIDENGLHSIQTPAVGNGNFCVFEYVYFARNDSVIDGLSVYQARMRMGELLFEQSPAEADLVCGVPDSALPAAMGYAEASGIPYGQALIKNTYSGRTFIQDGQHNREQSVRMKLSVLREAVEGKRIVLIDDSIVRGTNSMYFVRMLRRSGAKEVHMRIASPPVRFPCHFGINTPTSKRLAAAQLDIEELRKKIEADSLCYLQEEQLGNAVAGCRLGLCCACFDGKYPMPV
ncbi:amidophosphoribosyltransferase [Clostridia bacterium OttesenSCG-928-F22]|nr:amidophosphoribosyltransferase [Clostridia bacterium OttesenSCG-928-F22]